ncbi:uncharacterized protein TNCV_1173721 [Trichonephila clavipes]|uniref:Integrase catalytic domain-containing protein n=1 Tax=Trichonephila clavipes TaxID=2585209 RepID=A0A8X6RZ60_TRICX|nr:uncharacterized protein TNCV_1173721 [Trichonephila clavipes]
MYISDRGTAFTARHTQHFLQKYGMTQSMTPPYSPQANSIIVSTLKKLTDKNPDKWDELLPNALLAINTTKQNSTKKSPFYLLFGYEPRLPRELHIGSFMDDTPREDQLDLLILARAEAANNVYEAHLENKHRFDLHHRSCLFKAGDLVLYDWPKQGDHKFSPIFKGPFVIVRPNNTSDEENDSSAEDQDSAEDHQEVSVTTEPSSSRNHLDRNPRPPKRFEQYVS